MIRSFAIVAASLLWNLSPQISQAASPPDTVSSKDAEAWREDLAVLAKELPGRHKNAFARMSREEFAAAVQRLNDRIPAMRRDDIIVEMGRIVALVRDAHTGIQSLLYQSPAQFHFIPAGLYLFKDGLYVYAADKPYRAVVGGKVVRIGKATTDQAIAAVAPLISADNEMAVKERAPLYLESPEVLRALGLVDRIDRIPFVIQKGGRTATVTFPALPAPRPTKDNWALGQRFSKLPNWVDARSGDADPLWLRKPTEYFWHTFLPDSGTLYAQFNDVANKDKETVQSWVEQMQSKLEGDDVQRFVLDLRWNTGGNNYLNKPLLLALIKSRRINQPGRLFVIIGRRNFSAAQNLINDLANYTDAVFVGEPTASTPNFFGDSTGITLPNSKIVVRASTLWWQDADPRDPRKWTAPDLAAELAFDDYRRGRDPALDLILNYKPEPPLADRMFDEFTKGRADAAVDAYRRFKADPVRVYADTERPINSLGYRLLNQNKVQEAITVFRLNVESYPASPNVYDSLADAYLVAGDKKAALENYRKELELDPTNGNAANAIRRLESGG
jgi:tetratricopeptide (TPR) repeat protein